METQRQLAAIDTTKPGLPALGTNKGGRVLSELKAKQLAK